VWADFQISNVGIAANVASHQNITTSLANALGLTSLDGYVVQRSLFHVAIAPDAAEAAGASLRARSAIIVQDVSLAGAAGDGPLTQPYRDWFCMQQFVTQNGAAAYTPNISSALHTNVTDFRSKRRLRDITDVLFLITEADFACHYTAMGRVLLAMP